MRLHKGYTCTHMQLLQGFTLTQGEGAHPVMLTGSPSTPQSLDSTLKDRNKQTDQDRWKRGDLDSSRTLWKCNCFWGGMHWELFIQGPLARYRHAAPSVERGPSQLCGAWSPER